MIKYALKIILIFPFNVFPQEILLKEQSAIVDRHETRFASLMHKHIAVTDCIRLIDDVFNKATKKADLTGDYSLSGAINISFIFLPDSYDLAAFYSNINTLFLLKVNPYHTFTYISNCEITPLCLEPTFIPGLLGRQKAEDVRVFNNEADIPVVKREDLSIFARQWSYLIRDASSASGYFVLISSSAVVLVMLIAHYLSLKHDEGPVRVRARCPRERL